MSYNYFSKKKERDFSQNLISFVALITLISSDKISKQQKQRLNKVVIYHLIISFSRK